MSKGDTKAWGNMQLVRNKHGCNDEANNLGWNLSHERMYLLKQQVKVILRSNKLIIKIK